MSETRIKFRNRARFQSRYALLSMVWSNALLRTQSRVVLKLSKAVTSASPSTILSRIARPTFFIFIYPRGIKHHRFPLEDSTDSRTHNTTITSTRRLHTSQVAMRLISIPDIPFTDPSHGCSRDSLPFPIPLPSFIYGVTKRVHMW